jgi:enediyne biosynthesis protein E4
MKAFLSSATFSSTGLLIILFAAGCEQDNKSLFTKLSADESGVVFQNTIEESPSINIMNYEYTYNGGGVAAADFNNDGWCDLYFTGNVVSNRLYLNQRDLTFKDITEHAGVGGRPLWKTGVSVADVNADGWLDIYVCYSGPGANQSLSNELYINNGCEEDGEPTFTERATEYGLDASGTYSTQASFFDYDRDGDLDMFLINHGNHFYSPFINTNRLRTTRHPQFGNRLYRNDAIASSKPSGRINHFTEVSQEAGIHGGGLNFGLGLSISDVNNDHWPDIFVTNDYEEQDFLYINNKDGTFAESTKDSFGHLSRNGMGSDIADFNNDGRPDLIEVDMWPKDNFRQKLLKGPDDYHRYMLMVDSGLHYQQMRNTLQMNAGAGPDGVPLFCEIGQLAGVSATDWSWAPLLADLDNDGFKDLFVTNGYLRDFTSMDFLKYTVEEARTKAKQQGTELQLYELVSKMPSTKTSDYVFRNNGNLTFSDKTKEWGLDEPNLSFGAAYADLDNDGDLELITNNTNERSTIWLNNSTANAVNNYLRIQLTGPPSNPLAVGAKVYVYTGDSVQMQEQFPTRGYQSSVDPIIHFGLGKNRRAKKVSVIWPDGLQSTMADVNSNQQLRLSHATAVAIEDEITRHDKLFRDISDQSRVEYIHRESNFMDFDREPLIPYQLSRLGPALASGDVNGDGFDDFYVGGSSGQSGALYIADGSGRFQRAVAQPWEEDAGKEDTGAAFFDVDGDADLDLFVVSGGNEFPSGSEMLDDRLYINAGRGRFVKSPIGSTIADHASGSCAAAADFDKDGDIDLYVGGRLLPGNFPVTTPGAVLRNESDKGRSQIKFRVATNEVNPDLREPGMVTDAVWTDFNNDGWPDLLIVGHWMPARLFENKNGRFIEVANETLSRTWGMWNSIAPFDFDNDGDTDFVLGNAGDNFPFNVSEKEPLNLYYDDFNGDNRIDPIITFFSEGIEYPVASRDEMLLQINSLRKKYTNYSQYANATIADVLGRGALERSKKLKVQTLQSVVLENSGNGNFKILALPLMAQMSAVHGILTDDFNRDGFEDILIGGNFYPYKTEYGRSDASLGLLLAGDGKGAFHPVPWDESGFFAPGDVRDMAFLAAKHDRKYILIARNNDRLSLFALNNPD